MDLILRDGISCCEAGGRFIFLDVDGDRYFALATEAEQSFRRLVVRETIGSDDRANLGGLIENGLLVPAGNGDRPEPCPATPVTEHSLLEEEHRVDAIGLAHALYRLTLGALAMKLRPLAANLAGIAARKAGIGPGHERDEKAMRDVAAAFRRCGLVAAPLDQCLPRSIAVAHALLDRNIAPLLVIGVRLQPFAAHCWVQHGSTVVNERVDNVRNFTPILTV